MKVFPKVLSCPAHTCTPLARKELQKGQRRFLDSTKKYQFAAIISPISSAI